MATSQAITTEDQFAGLLAQHQDAMIRQQSQQQAQQQAGLGLGVLGGIGQALSGGAAFNGTSTTPFPQADIKDFFESQRIRKPMTAPFNPRRSHNSRMTKFYRINEEVSMGEMDRADKFDPVDELRIKVANWLYN